MQDYKSLRVAVTIWATLVNAHTHTDRSTALIGYTISSAAAELQILDFFRF